MIWIKPIKTTAANRYSTPCRGNQRDDDDRNRARRAGDHSRSAAECRRDQTDDKCRIKSDQRADSGNDRKRDRFRHERERDRQTRQNLVLEVVLFVS